ncbi:hypothetical protein GCM10010211_35040 [Streptomyces albospinus]|uniref:Uncharacterized protein n=1 Tax=Streptomyces albospinus TaxID=285515 RepID=A0ABQ2V4V2_9ACTN|nr:hypothetical protein GCM10010211_35040 [Streptomyces albospinus]
MPGRTAARWTSQRRPHKRRLDSQAVRNTSLRPRSALVLEAVFTTLLVLVAVGVIAFAGLTWKKLYQGQR